MSSQPSTPLPPAWVDRLFARMVAIYGVQKVGAMWQGAEAGPGERDAAMASIKALWGEQLGRFKPESIAGALQRLVDSGDEWPPTLPAFVKLCREAAQERATSRHALPAPPGRMPAGYALPDLSTNRDGIDYLRWLRRVGHISVARAFPEIARRDPRVQDILERHIATDFGEIVDPAAAAWLRAWVAANPHWRADFQRQEDAV